MLGFLSGLLNSQLQPKPKREPRGFNLVTGESTHNRRSADDGSGSMRPSNSKAKRLVPSQIDTSTNTISNHDALNFSFSAQQERKSHGHIGLSSANTKAIPNKRDRTKRVTTTTTTAVIPLEEQAQEDRCF
jgi:hypothetical protein